MLAVNEVKHEPESFKKVKIHKTREFQRIGNWILAGSGNFEETQGDGRYREN